MATCYCATCADHRIHPAEMDPVEMDTTPVLGDLVTPDHKGLPLTFGVHRQDARNAETAPAWPSMTVVSGRLKRRTDRALRAVK